MSKKYVAVAVTLALMVFCFVTTKAFGFRVTDNLDVTGYVQNYTDIFTQDTTIRHGIETHEAGDVGLCRTFLNVEPEFKLSDNASFYGVWRGWYEGRFDLMHNGGQDPIHKDLYEDDMWRDYEWREAYVDVSSGPWAFRLGKQQVVWGEADNFRMADVVNPLDTSWNPFQPDWEELRIPMWTAKVMRPVGPWDGEFVWIPTDFEPNVLAPMTPFPGKSGRGIAGLPGSLSPREDPAAPQYAPWAPPQAVTYAYMPALTTKNIWDPDTNPNAPVLGWAQVPVGAIEDKVEDDLENGTVGARFSRIVKGWDFSLYSLWTRSADPAVYLPIKEIAPDTGIDAPVGAESIVETVPGLVGLPGGDDSIGLCIEPKGVNTAHMTYNRQAIFGGTANYYWNRTKSVVRLEAKYIHNQAFTRVRNRMIAGPAPYSGEGVGSPYPGIPGSLILNERTPGSSTTSALIDQGFDIVATPTWVPEVQRKDVAGLMIALDRPTIFRWQPKRSFFLSGQLFLTYILNHDDDLASPLEMEPDTIPELDTTITLHADTGYNYDTILPGLTLAYNAEGNGMIWPECIFKQGDYWVYEIGAIFFMGNDPMDPPMGVFRDNDFVYARVKIGF
jgi:hypothetical protein